YLSPQPASLPRSPVLPTQAAGTPPLAPTYYPGVAPYSQQQSGAIAPPPPTYPTQYAGTPPYQHMGSSGYGNYPAQAGPATGTVDKKVEVWKIGKHQIGAMIAGAFIFSILVGIDIGVNIQFASNSYYNQVAYNIFNIVLAALVLVTPVFFGSVFGPWVGLFTGGIGTLIVI